jgi:hypothetical protein
MHPDSDSGNGNSCGGGGDKYLLQVNPFTHYLNSLYPDGRQTF